MIVARDVAEALARRAEDVCRMLLPNGKKKGRRWFAGDVHGAAGESLVVELGGSKIGMWGDFADGSPDGRTGGDLLDLWAVNNRKSIGEVIAEAANYAGMQVTNDSVPRHTQHYKKPDVPHVMSTLPPHILEWFANRGISEATLTENMVKFGRMNHWPSSCIIYPMFTGGKCRAIRYRVDPTAGEKTFWTSKETAPLLYGWPAIDQHARSVVLCEGYEDAMLAQEMGVNALSVPFGAGSGAKQQWLDEEWERLGQFDDIILAMDPDGAGAAAVKEIIKRIGQLRTRILALGGKDITDWWRAGGRAEAFIELCRSAKPMDLEIVKSVGHYRERVFEMLDQGGFDSPEDCFQFPWQGMDDWKIREGSLILFTGHSGAGKSTFTSFLSLLHGLQEYRSLIASLEIPGEMTSMGMAMQAFGSPSATQQHKEKCFNYMEKCVWLYDKVGNTTPEELLIAMEYAYRRYGIKVFVIDSLLKLGISEKDSDRLVYVTNLLLEFRVKFPVFIWVVAHQIKHTDNKFAKKGPDWPTKGGIRGSGSFTDLADYIIGGYRSTEDDKAEAAKKGYQLGDFLLSPIKWRYCNYPPKGRKALWFKVENKRYYGSPYLRDKLDFEKAEAIYDNDSSRAEGEAGKDQQTLLAESESGDDRVI